MEVRSLTGVGAEKAVARALRLGDGVPTRSASAEPRVGIAMLRVPEDQRRTRYAFALLAYAFAAIMVGTTLPTPMYALYARAACTSRC